MSFGTWLHTKLHGIIVGEDDYGNVYYKSNKMRGTRQERWVIYKGEPEASKVPPEWHSWLHHTTDEPLTSAKRAWQKPHLPNLTGTAQAYMPPGADQRGGQRAKAADDYQAWSPEA